MKTAVRLEKVTINLAGKKILDNVTLSLPESKVVGLLGPSGAGKTTLMRALVGLQKVIAGTVTVLGRPAGSAELRPLIGYVTQSPSVYGDLTVAENLEYFAAMLGVTKARMEEIVGLVHLEDQTGQIVASLSGGQRARVSLGVALLGSPRLLVLDEPTVGLDPILRTELWEQFHELARGGVTLLISSHVMDEAKRCDSLALMRDGRMLATGTPAELMGGTDTHDIEAAFLKLVEAAS